MKLCALIVISLVPLLASCGGGRGSSECATKLSYLTDINKSGQQAINNASVYMADLYLDNNEHYLSAKLDTGSANLIINEKDYVAGSTSRFGSKSYDFQNNEQKSLAINAQDSITMACSVNMNTQFMLSDEKSHSENVLGLSFGDPARIPHEAKSKPFFAQLVTEQGFSDIISLALCGTRGYSRALLGGVDKKMAPLVSQFIPISEKSSYVVPALSLKRADNKKFLGDFPDYDPETKRGRKTILNSGSAFNQWPTKLAEAATAEIVNFALDNNMQDFFPEGFFRTERSAAIKLVRFKNLAQIRQFPSFEIDFYGADGKIKSLELSPEHYFKEMNIHDTMWRTYAIRESTDDVVLGQPFFENHYTVLDRKNSRVGFANIDLACAP